jgi:hypothetical protein
MVYMLMADFPYGDRIKFYGAKIFHRNGTLECKVPQYARSGEPYTF